MHCFASAAIPRTHAAQAKRLARGNALSRCFYLTRILAWAGGVVACTRCRQSCRRRPRSLPAPGVGRAPARERAPESETESEEGQTACEADVVAMSVLGTAVPLSAELCRERSTLALTPLLPEDAGLSDTRGLHVEEGVHLFHACAAHQAVYEVHPTKLRCAVEGCNQAYESVVGGVRRCRSHARTDGVKWAVPEVTPRAAATSSLKETPRAVRTPPPFGPFQPKQYSDRQAGIRPQGCQPRLW